MVSCGGRGAAERIANAADCNSATANLASGLLGRSTAFQPKITDERLYVRRRDFFRLGAGAAVGAIAGLARRPTSAQTSLPNIRKGPFETNEKWNSFGHITGYNNSYEFGTDKSGPFRYSIRLKTSLWTVKVDGHCNKPAALAVRIQPLPQPVEQRAGHSVSWTGRTDIAQTLGLAQHAEPVSVYAVLDGPGPTRFHGSRLRETRGRIGQLALLPSLRSDD